MAAWIVAIAASSRSAERSMPLASAANPGCSSCVSMDIVPRLPNHPGEVREPMQVWPHVGASCRERAADAVFADAHFPDPRDGSFDSADRGGVQAAVAGGDADEPAGRLAGAGPCPGRKADAGDDGAVPETRGLCPCDRCRR